jgi:uncharacterized protein (TIGR02246 family)
MRKRRLFSLAFCLTAVLAFGLLLALGKMLAQADEAKADQKGTPGHGKRAQEFIDAFNRGDAKTVASFWMENGDYIDQEGHQVKGRAALEKLYQKVFAERPGAKLTVHVTSTRMVTPDVALEEGISEVAPPDGGPPSAAEFSAVLVKKYGQWYFESVRDSIAHPPSNAQHFDDLQWLIGDWTSEAEKGEGATASYIWEDNRNFIVSKFATTLNGIPVIGGTQWVAWDAVDKQIRSWSFYSQGGTGEAVWNKDGNRWAIKTTAKTAAGKKVSATNILTRIDADHATWQMTRVTVDGQSMPEPRPVKMKRVQPERP